MVRALINPQLRRDDRFRGLFADTDYRDVRAFAAAHSELTPTPLRSLPGLADELGLRALSLKDESSRHGLNAFKIIGVRYAVHRLGPDAASRGLVCATAGNHGRAVARVASEHRLACTVFLPAARTVADGAHESELGTRATRVAAMRDDGATVVEVDGSYEEAVRVAAAHAASTGGTVVSDTSWPGYEEIPRRIMAGYTQVFEEASSKWDGRPDVVLVQGGVGGLVCAAVSWCAWRFGADRPRVIACEPEAAACLLESAAAGDPVTVSGPLDTIMAGLRCAEPSPAAWPAIRDGVDAFVSVPDALVIEAMDRLRHPEGRDPKVDAGPSGACGVAALFALMRSPELDATRRALRLDRTTHALAVITEGP